MAEDTNTDAKSNTFSWLRDLLQLSLRSSTKHVATFLFLSFDIETKECYPSTRAIAMGCGITIRSAQLGLAELRDAGAINFEQRGKLLVISPAQPPAPNQAQGIAPKRARGCAGQRKGLRTIEHPQEHPKEHLGQRKGLRGQKGTNDEFKFEGARMRRRA